jgi:hypothetical protein
MATFETLLAGKPASVQATARAARAYLRSLGPDVAERYEGGEVVYLRGPHPFCAIVVESRAARIRLSGDTPAEEPGRGQRAIALHTPTDLTSANRALVRAAYEAARR